MLLEGWKNTEMQNLIEIIRNKHNIYVGGSRLGIRLNCTRLYNTLPYVSLIQVLTGLSL